MITYGGEMTMTENLEGVVLDKRIMRGKLFLILFWVLTITNIYFDHKEEWFVTFKSGLNSSQMD